MYRLAEVRLVERERPTSCWSPADLALHADDMCVIEDGRTKECGWVTGLAEPAEGTPPANLARVLRRATLQDQSKADENAVRGRMARGTCQAIAARRGLHLHFLSVHFSFDREVLHVLYAAEPETDVREFARDLGTEIKARVDLRMLGVRDEAQMLGGIGPCGRRICCASWLRRFESINVKMAKVQNLALNPMAMSGMCGRLKCCLRYEFDTYQETGRKLPRQGCTVKCPGGTGCVIARNILAERVTVRLEDQRVQHYAASEVTEAPHKGPPKKGDAHEDSGDEWPQPGAAGDA